MQKRRGGGGGGESLGVREEIWCRVWTCHKVASTDLKMLGVLSETITREMEHMFSEKKSSLAETDHTLVPTDFWTSMRRAWHDFGCLFPLLLLRISYH